jgi:transposase InsO family protein
VQEELKPKNHQEAVAVFRHGVVGALTQAQMDRGELLAALKALTQQRFVPPRAKVARTFSVATLERWYYAFKKRGLDGLKPRGRKDRGRAKELTAPQRTLVLDIRREYPSASVPLILRTLETDGRLQKGVVSASTVRRLFAEAGLDRVGLRLGGHTGRVRLRWQAERPMALWQGDVCHGPALTLDGKSRPLRVHALLDDASRYVIALEAHHTEREVDMLGLMVRALRRHGTPDALYLDNGSTYRGETLATACARIGTALLHARPYDAPARGKMERFWRTLREGCLDVLGPVKSLHDVNVRLWAFLDAHYHQNAHASLLGQTPAAVFSTMEAKPDGFDEAKLREALTVRIRRRVRTDGTVSLDGRDYEVDGAHLAGRLANLCRCLVDVDEAPWLEIEGQRLALHPVDAVANGKRRRERPPPKHDESCPRHPAFEPAQALLDKATGRPPAYREGSAE